MAKKLISILAAFTCAAAACVGSISASAENVSSVKTSGNLNYVIVDEDEDGVNDFVRITSCSSSAESVLIPKTIDDFTVQEIADGAFANASSLISVNADPQNSYFSAVDGVLFNKNATRLVCYPRAKKTAKSYSIPSSVNVIGDSAFANCSILSKITIPSSVKTIGTAAFINCTSLDDAAIPSSVTSVGTDAFLHTKLLQDQIINKTGPLYYASSWLIYSDYNITNVMADSNAIKAGTVGIAGGSFTNHKSLTKVDIPATVAYIGEGAFSDCTSLASLTLPSSLESVEQGAFSGCSSLVELSVPNTVSVLGKAVFAYCTKLAKVNIPTGISILPEQTFEGCSSLVTADIPANVSLIEKLAFYNCDNLAKVIIRDKNCSIENKPQTFSNSNTTYEGVISGYENSSAQTYANTHNRTFEILGASPDTPSGIKGDANGDGSVNVRDCAFIANQLALGKGNALPLSGDFNGDGKVNVRDAAGIANSLAHGSKE